MTKFKRLAQNVNRSGVLFFCLAFPVIVLVIWLLLKVSDVIWPGCCG